MEDDNQGFGIYDDLDDELELSIKPKLEEDNEYSTEENKGMVELQTKVEELNQTVEKLTKENAILKRNISCIFKTGQMEIQRKDAEIARLKTELENMQKRSRR